MLRKNAENLVFLVCKGLNFIGTHAIFYSEETAN